MLLYMTENVKKSIFLDNRLSTETVNTYISNQNVYKVLFKHIFVQSDTRARPKCCVASAIAFVVHFAFNGR